MATKFVDRLHVVLRARGWSPYEWSQQAHLSDATVANMITRNQKSGRTDSLEALAAAASVPFEWLARGVGESGLVDPGAPADGEQAADYDAKVSTPAELDELIRAARNRATRERRAIHEFAWVELRRVLPLFSDGKVSVASAVDIAQAFSEDNIGKHAAAVAGVSGPRLVTPTPLSATSPEKVGGE